MIFFLSVCSYSPFELFPPNLKPKGGAWVEDMEEKVYFLFKSLILFAKMQTCSYLPWSLQTNYTMTVQCALYKSSPYLYLN